MQQKQNRKDIFSQKNPRKPSRSIKISFYNFITRLENCSITSSLENRFLLSIHQHADCTSAPVNTAAKSSGLVSRTFPRRARIRAEHGMSVEYLFQAPLSAQRGQNASRRRVGLLLRAPSARRASSCRKRQADTPPRFYDGREKHRGNDESAVLRRKGAGRQVDRGHIPRKFFHTNLWLTFHNMLAFKRYRSAIEAKRYFRRFTHFMPESDYLCSLCRETYQTDPKSSPRGAKTLRLSIST